ncbi:MAG: tryptophan halogenase family protein, partial [Pseudomonadota bacterium]
TDDPRSPLAQMRHAYHIDAGRYAAFLREYAEARGVQRLEGRIETIEQHSETGDIIALQLEHGVTVGGDFFIDCTGFRALLIGETLDSGWLDWSHWLPCDRAVAVPSEPAATLASHTQATALTAGWQWRIPLQHRTGNGHVYCSAFMDDDTATAQLLDNLATAPTDSPRTLKFSTGRRHALWQNNCVAIGLSSGFVEPLESTSIHLIQEGISKLLALFPGHDDPAPQRHEYNQLMARLYDDIRDFIILHYTINHRQDAPFWQQLATMTLPDSLTERIDRFTPRGQWFAHRADLFTETSWVAVMIGQGLEPKGHHPLIGALEHDAIASQFREMATVYHEASAHMPPHAAYINRFCAAPDNAYLEHHR